MTPDRPPIAFGPVPSRRLGQSLGVNNVFPKPCSYSCAYCQVGRTAAKEIAPRTFHEPRALVSAIERRLRLLRERGERVDYVTFVADGEPTLDQNLGEAIERMRSLGVPVAVISNGSLLWREDVRRALRRADWVSLKVDTVDERIWRRLDRPHPSLDLKLVLDGMLAFAAEFHGLLASETLLVRNVNDEPAGMEAVAEFLERLKPRCAYAAVPTRPPAEPWVRPAGAAAINRCFQRFARRLPRVELLTGFEGASFGTTGAAEDDLLATAAVHPVREDVAAAVLVKAGGRPSDLQRLVAEGRLRPVRYEGHVFYLWSRGSASDPADAAHPEEA